MVGSETNPSQKFRTLAKKPGHVAAEYLCHVVLGDEFAVQAEVVQRLPVGAVALDVGHVRGPCQPVGPVAFEILPEDGPRLDEGILLDEALEDRHEQLD